ncbi:MAG: Hcp family type VI secretion system effector [Beijerinckiaceae bacterium]
MANIYAFLDLDGIEGESQDSEYQKKIELLSFSWGASNNSSFSAGTGAGIGKGQIHDMHFTAFASKASLKLMERSVNGKAISSGTVTLLKQSGDTKIAYLKYELTNIVVTNFEMSASGNGELPTESFTLHFVKVKSSYQPQGNEGDPAGNVDFGWNLQENAAA